MKDLNLKFLLDENVDVRVATFLRDQGYSVLLCPKGITNGAVAALAKKENRVLLTNDTDFTHNPQKAKVDHPSVIVFRIHPPSVVLLTNALREFLTRGSGKMLTGRVYVLEK